MSKSLPTGEAKTPSPLCKSVPALSAMILGLAAVAVAVPGASAAAPAEQDISGVWWASTYSPNISLIGGGALPYNAAGKAAYDKNIAGLKDGSLVDAARRYCAPDGVPRLLETPYPFEIVQTPGQVTIVHELNHFVRPIAMDRLPPKCKIACNIDPLRGLFASNSDPL